jgi:hypothetical protein
MAYLEQGAMAGVVDLEFVLFFVRFWYLAVPAAGLFIIAGTAVSSGIMAAARMARRRRFLREYKGVDK